VLAQYIPMSTIDIKNSDRVVLRPDAERREAAYVPPVSSEVRGHCIAYSVIEIVTFSDKASRFSVY
jgi:hypothetical protein